MLKRFLEGIGLLNDDPLETQIWHCDPLVVVDDDGVLAYSERTRVEFEPTGQPEPLGQAKVLDHPRDGWLPTMTVLSRLVLAPMPIYIARRGWRDGITLRGYDEEGFWFTWNVNGAADEYLVNQSRPDPEAEEC